MQAAKTLLTLLALGLCVVPVSQARPDTEAQAKAREALRKKIAESEGQPASVAPATPAPAAEAKPAKPAKVAAAPVAAGAGLSEVPAAAPGTMQATPEQIERLRESTRRQISELNAQGYAAPPVAAAAPGTAQPTPEQIERLRESTRQKISGLNAQENAAPAVVETPTKSKPAPAATAFDPIPAPPTNIAASKETRLADLLKKYKSDEISPAAYHTERAKILAEP